MEPIGDGPKSLALRQRETIVLLFLRIYTYKAMFSLNETFKSLKTAQIETMLPKMSSNLLYLLKLIIYYIY